MSTRGQDRQVQIYTSGDEDDLPIAVEEWEGRARDVLDEGPFDYVAGGAGAEDTMRANREAFHRYRIVPRMLRDVTGRDLGVTLLGTRFPLPFLLAPVGVQGILHPEGERAAARAAVKNGVAYVLSTVSSVTIEQVAEDMGDAPRWFQLYPGCDEEVVTSLVKRAEASGYSALVVTLDTTMLGWRERDLRRRYLPFLQAQGLANFLTDPVFRSRLPVPPEENPLPAVMRFLETYVNPAFSWVDLDRLRRRTTLPLLLKGVLHPHDAREALDHGVDGIIVSNHGGRQVDGAIAALDALPAVHDALRGRIPVLMDSGIRHGADVLKAIALGAEAVLLGRPYLYGLAVAGEVGVDAVIRNLAAEIDLELGLAGHCSVEELGSDLLEVSAR